LGQNLDPKYSAGHNNDKKSPWEQKLCNFDIILAQKKQLVINFYDSNEVLAGQKSPAGPSMDTLQ